MFSGPNVVQTGANGVRAVVMEGKSILKSNPKDSHGIRDVDRHTQDGKFGEAKCFQFGDALASGKHYGIRFGWVHG